MWKRELPAKNEATLLKLKLLRPDELPGKHLSTTDRKMVIVCATQTNNANAELEAEAEATEYLDFNDMSVDEKAKTVAGKRALQNFVCDEKFMSEIQATQMAADAGWADIEIFFFSFNIPSSYTFLT